MNGEAERITWGECPGCGDRMAVGWIGAGIAEIDCVNACELSGEQAALSTCCKVGLVVYPSDCPEHGPQVPADLLNIVCEEVDRGSGPIEP